MFASFIDFGKACDRVYTDETMEMLGREGLEWERDWFPNNSLFGNKLEVKVGDEYSGSFEVTILICTWDTFCCRCCSPLYINSIVDILSEARVGVE